jgi:hypothetical protein
VVAKLAAGVAEKTRRRRRRNCCAIKEEEEEEEEIISENPPPTLGVVRQSFSYNVLSFVKITAFFLNHQRIGRARTRITTPPADSRSEMHLSRPCYLSI